MKKIQKITAISLTFLTLICVSQFVMGLVPLTFSEEPVLTWGVAPEDEFTWDAGFDIDIEMDNSLWSYLSTIVNTQMHQPPGSWVDTKAIFDAFKSMSKQYQIKAIVQNIFNTSSSLDAVNATYFLKMLKDNAFSKPTAFLKQLNDTWAQFVKDNFPTNIANTILEKFSVRR